MMKIAVIGAKGNMGNRYCQILKYLQHEVVEVDIGLYQEDEVRKCDGIIIATPTHRHIQDIFEYSEFGLPILCEKPITTTNPDQLIELCKQDKAPPLRMLNQYEYYQKDIKLCIPNSYYNYFKTGSDGLYWDCINIIGLSKGDIIIKNDSPMWLCVLNGKQLNIGEMDLAYIWNIEDWLSKFDDNRDYILEAHQKVQDFINANSSNRNTGETS